MGKQPKHVCIQCSRNQGVIQHIDIAWPLTIPMKRHFYEGWVHAECEKILIERIERAWGGIK